MRLFTYKHQCDKCDKKFESTYIKRYKKPRHKKTCPSCVQTKVEVEDLGGLNGWGSCGECQHFMRHGDKADKCWGNCGLGHESSNEDEYTLSWAIDNVVGCMIPYEHHEEYGDDIYGLVYCEDYCVDFEEGSDHELSTD